jgi:hypothetical protein
MSTLQHWIRRPAPETLPLDDVVAEFRRAGRRFVDPKLLEALAQARAALPDGDCAQRRFLDAALGEHDDGADNAGYVACSFGTDLGRASWQRDRLMMLLVADLLRFDLAGLDATTEELPLMRPQRRVVAKRCTLGLRALRPAMVRLGLQAAEEPEDPITGARSLCARVADEQTDDERYMLAVTLLTVFTAHDEHLYVRVLQCYETTFALVAVRLQAATYAARAGDAGRTARALRLAVKTMAEVRPLISLLATISSGAVMTFGEHATEARGRVLAGRRALQKAVADCWDPAGEIHEAMAAFEASVVAWRKRHHNLTLHWLGTGHSAAAPRIARAA